MVLPSWFRLTLVVLEKRLLNGCSVTLETIGHGQYHVTYKFLFFLLKIVNLPEHYDEFEL